MMALYRSPDFNVFSISCHGNQSSAWISILYKNVNFLRGFASNYFYNIILKSGQELIFYDLFQVISIGFHSN